LQLSWQPYKKKHKPTTTIEKFYFFIPEGLTASQALFRNDGLQVSIKFIFVSDK
jgi:hypothetical protein